MKNQKNKILMIIFTILALAVNVFIISEAAMSGSSSASQSGWVANIIAKTFNITPNENYHHIIRKFVGHFSLYVIDGLTTTLSEYHILKYVNKYQIKAFAITSLVLGVFLSSLSEFVQLLAVNRGFAFTDMLINFSGFFVGGMIIFFFDLLSSKTKKHYT